MLQLWKTNKKYHTVETIPKSNIKIVERGKIDRPYTQIHDGSRLGTGTPIKGGEFKLVFGPKQYTLNWLPSSIFSGKYKRHLFWY